MTKIKVNYIVIPAYTFLISFLGNYFGKEGQGSWYHTIMLPFYTPPDWVFGLVWPIIFIMATISALLIWNSLKDRKASSWLLFIFFINGLLNVLWSYLFFYKHTIGWALVDAIMLLLSTIIICIVSWHYKQKKAALLMIPYAAWLLFALMLNSHIWMIN